MTVVQLRRRCSCGAALDLAPASSFCSSCRKKRARTFRRTLLAARARELVEAIDAAGLEAEPVGGLVIVDAVGVARVLEIHRALRLELSGG